jgi:hypothetical protein
MNGTIIVDARRFRGSARTKARLGSTWCVLAALAGCAGGDGTSAPPANAVQSFCKGTAVDMGRQNLVEFPNLGRTARAFACNTDGVWSWQWRDTETDEVVDVEALGREDALAFKLERHALDPVLEEKLASLPDDAMVDVEVWYAVDESDLPSREEQLESSLVATESQWELERRTLAGAARMTTSITGEMGTNVVMSSDMVERGVIRAPFLPLRVRASELTALGDLPGVTRVMSVEPTVDLTSADYYRNEEADELVDYEFNGSGSVVALVENRTPDIWEQLTGAVSGISGHDCTDTLGMVRSCHCPGAARSGHSRGTTGVVRSSALSWGGFAADAQTLMANLGEGEGEWDSTTNTCAGNGFTYGQSPFTSAVNWALNYGATVFNASFGSGLDVATQSSKDLYWDYVATHAPWPFIAASAGNSGMGKYTSNKLRNGIVVGGANDQNVAGRSQVVMYDVSSTEGSHSRNANGWELPHIVAEAVGVRTAVGGTAGSTGTSFAAPQISAMAASLHEWNPNLVGRPEATAVGIMVGADENVDEAKGGVWPRDPGDSFDDYDGAGLVNGRISKLVLATGSKRNGGNSPNGVGHDYGELSATTSPVGTFQEVWRARVHPGQTLVATSVMSSTVACSSSGSEFSCTTNKFPLHALKIDDGTTFFGNPNFSQNYQAASLKNTSSSDKIYNISIVITSWNNVSTSRYAVGWVVM